MLVVFPNSSVFKLTKTIQLASSWHGVLTIRILLDEERQETSKSRLLRNLSSHIGDLLAKLIEVTFEEILFKWERKQSFS